MLPFPGCARLLPSARGAISGRRLRRRYSGKAAGTLRSCWSVNSPGDREDREGRPFAGPAARILDVALREVGIDRSDVYVTNVVKHFRWQGAAPGKRRIHKKPRASEINACRPWLDAELAVVRPQVWLCLGATAAQALLGRHVSVNQDRGRFVESSLAPHVMAPPCTRPPSFARPIPQPAMPR